MELTKACLKIFFKAVLILELYLLYVQCDDFLGQDQNIEQTFERLSEVNSQWLKLISVPEVACLLNNRPYRHPSNRYTSEVPNVSETLAFLHNSSSDVARIMGKNCSDDLIRIITNLSSQWALQMLDSEGKLSSGILRGQFIWPGDYNECNNIYAPPDKNGQGGFHGKYCMSSWTLNVTKNYPNLPLFVGLCIPDSCSGEHLNTAIVNVIGMLDHEPVLKGMKSHLSLNSITCKNKRKNWDRASIIYFVIISIILMLALVGSVLTVIDQRKSKFMLQRKNSRAVAPATSKDDVHVSENFTTSSEVVENEAVNNSIDKEVSNIKKVHTPQIELKDVRLLFRIKRESLVKRVLLCFSMFSNGAKILNTETHPDEMLFIHGLKFLSLMWIIGGHTSVSAIPVIGNKLDAVKFLDSFILQVLIQASYAVDSFFVISGFLVTYLFLKEISKRNGYMNWPIFYAHRIWRLSPAYLVSVFFYLFIFKYTASGPFWDDHHCDNARNTWWRYLIYINNFIPIKQMCLGWSWYLANELQFYLVSPLFLYPLWRWPVAGFCILGAFLAATWTTTGIMTYMYDIIPMFSGMTKITDLVAYEKATWESYDLIYDKPYCRISPYIIGATLGYILYKNAGRKNFLTWWQQALGWAVACALSLSVVFGLYHVDVNRTLAIFYNTFGRSAFALGIAWLIFACETGHGGFVNGLLSWKFWIPLGRITYSAYLVHPIIIHGYYLSCKSTLYVTQFMVVTNILGFTVISYGIAFFYSLVFESPLLKVEKLLLQKYDK